MKKILTFPTLILLVLTCGCSSGSENREKLKSAFDENFGFGPPESVREIKLKNYWIYDSKVHWMGFTYDPKVVKKIIAHDQPLNIAENKTSKFQDIITDLRKNVNNPDWLIIPNNETDRIYYKNDFLDHTSSEYFLWTDKTTSMTFLYVSFFD